MNCSRNTKRRVKIRCPVNPWAIAKYAALTLLGVLLFRAGSVKAFADRGYQAIGGEVFALFIPVFYWMFSRVIRDFMDDMKKAWRERKRSSVRTNAL